MTDHTCTIRTATAGVCGKPAVYTWIAGNGETLGECAEHYIPTSSDRAPVSGYRVGDAVDIQRHGKTYVGRVVRVGARGAVYAAVTYNNGATREVRV